MASVYPREDRRSAHARGYTKAWAKCSKQFLSTYYFCGMRPNQQAPVMSDCHRRGLKTPATQTDHVTPHRGDQVLFWDEGNLQALCMSCHSRKTAWESENRR